MVKRPGKRPVRRFTSRDKLRPRGSDLKYRPTEPRSPGTCVTKTYQQKRGCPSSVLALAAVMASPVVAAPTPKRMQVWANNKQSYDVVINDTDRTLRNTPLELIQEIDEQYGSMQARLQLKTVYETSPELATTELGVSDAEARTIIGGLGDVADQGSEFVDIHRKILTHSPDKGLNRLTNRALNEAGDVFDAVKNKKYKNATEDSALWGAGRGQIEELRHRHGRAVDAQRLLLNQGAARRSSGSIIS
jgi:hypothetical protein